MYGDTWYVNKNGNDTLNGTSEFFVSGYNGPKKTINALLPLAAAGDTILIGSGYYNESVILEKSLHVFVDSVDIHVLNINGPSIDVYVYGDTLRVRDSLLLNSGVFHVQDNNVVFYATYYAYVSTGSAMSYITGKFYRRTATGTGKMYFPVGVGTDFRPVTIDFHQLVADSRLHYIRAVADTARTIDPLPTGIRNLSTRHYWDFGRIGTGQTTDYIFSLSYDSTNIDDQVYDRASVRVMFSWYAGNWVNLSGNGNADRKGIAQAGNSVDTVGLLTLGNISGGLNPLGSLSPFAKFSFTGMCDVSNFVFKNASLLMAPATLTKRMWDFGDPLISTDTSSALNPIFKYSKPGNYTVKLTLINNNGDVDSASLLAVVKATPKAYIENANVCFSKFSRFKDTSTLLGPDTLVSRNWNLGDGTNVQGKSIAYTYGAAGTYAVKLKVMSNGGCADSMIRNTVVYPQPSPSFLSSNNCLGDTFTFNRVKSMIPADNLITYNWYDNYKFVKTDTSYKAVLSNVGNHVITLKATTNFGCVDSVVKSATVLGLPKLSFNRDLALPYNDSIQCFTTNKFTLTASSIVGQGQTIAAANWKWGDGTTTTSSDSVHSYLSEGVYVVKYIASSNFGCIDSVSKTYVVRGKVVPNFGKVGVCAPDSITFFDSATFTTSPISSYSWNFPGGVNLSGKTVRHWNKPTGPINVTMIATNNEGCIDSITKSFSFTQYPVINWLLNGSMPFCIGDSISVKADGGLQMLWLSDNDTNRTKNLKSAGYYKVKASNSLQCYSVDSFLVVLFPTPNIRVNSDTTIYRGTSAVLSAKGGIAYKWLPFKYLSDSTSANVICSAVDSIQYQLKGTTANGCSQTRTVTVRVVDKPVIRIPNLITPNGDGENDFWVVSELRDLDKYDVTIANYAGKVVFTTSNYKNNWNATQDGKLLPEGVYYYLMKNRRTSEEFKGFIQVIR